MAKKRVTRKRVNDPTINEALRDIYDKIDGLQPNSSDYITPTPPVEGDTTVVTDDDGNTTTAMYTGNEWLVDINANFQPVGTSRGWKSALGASGRSRIPIFNEAIRYDRKNNVAIVNSKKQKVNLSNNDGALAVSGDTLKIGTDGTGLTLKNTSGVLHVRNEADSADAIVNSKYIKLTGEDTAVENSIGLNSTFGPIIRAPGMALDGASIPALTNGFNQACNVEDGSSNIVLTAANAYLTVGQVVSGTGIPTSGKVCYVGVKAGDNASFTLYRDGIAVNADDDATGTTIRFNNFGMAKFVEMSAGAPSFIQYQTSVTTTPNCWGIGVDPYESPASALSSGRPDDAPFIISYNGGSPLTSDTFHSARKLVIDASGVVNFLGDIKLHATASDDGEVATIGVADSTGILTIAATASDDTYADIVLNAGGDIELNADTGIITFKDDGTILGLFSSGVFNLRGNLELESTTGEKTTLSVADATGIFTIATTASDATDADIIIDAGGHVEFDGCGVGFDRPTALTFGDAAVTTAGGNSTDVDFRVGNKHVLELTGNITSGSSEYLSFIFPAVSGNFLLVLGQDNTGTRTIGTSAAWRAYASDASEADNTLFINGIDARVRWAGGITPTLTTTADKTDIISMYWDADSQTCFATITQNF